MKIDDSPLYEVILPTSGTGLKEIKNLYKKRKKQVQKAIEKLRRYPTDYRLKGIEKLKDFQLGDYSIRISSGDRIFYDVLHKEKKVLLLRAGKHDLYKLS